MKIKSLVIVYILRQCSDFLRKIFFSLKIHLYRNFLCKKDFYNFQLVGEKIERLVNLDAHFEHATRAYEKHRAKIVREIAKDLKKQEEKARLMERDARKKLKKNKKKMIV